jgi:hypothetical protein
VSDHPHNISHWQQHPKACVVSNVRITWWDALPVELSHLRKETIVNMLHRHSAQIQLAQAVCRRGVYRYQLVATHHSPTGRLINNMPPCTVVHACQEKPGGQEQYHASTLVPIEGPTLTNRGML